MSFYVEHPQEFLKKLLEQGVPGNGKSQLSAIHELCEQLRNELAEGFHTQAVTGRCIEAGLLPPDGQMYRKPIGLMCIKLINHWVRYIHAELALKARLDSPQHVFSRLMMTVEVRSQATLQKIHRVCSDLYAEGHRDFSRLGIRPHLAAQKVLQPHSMLSKSFEVYYELTDCWDAFAHPHYTPVEVPGRPVRKSADIDFGWFAREYPQYEQWRLLLVEWLRTGDRKAMQQTLQAGSLFLKDYLVGLKLPSDPLALLSRTATVPDFFDKVASKRADSGTSYTNKIVGFINWVLLKLCSDIGDDGVLYVSPLFRNPFGKQTGSGKADSQSLKPTLPYAYISELQAMCSGLMYPDTDLGENARHGEVFDEQAETYVFPGVQTAGGVSGAGSRI